MLDFDMIQAPFASAYYLRLSFRWRTWIFSLSWQVPNFIHLWIDEYEYYDYVWRPDPATYPLIYQPRVPIEYYEED